MATRADVERLTAAHAGVRRLAGDALGQLWATLDPSDPLAVRAALEDVLPELTAMYGDVAATVAADFYDDLRVQSGVRGRFTAQLAPTFPTEAVQANGRWAIGPLFDANPDPPAALSRLQVEMDRMVLQPSRDTIATSAAADPARPRWARVPRGAKTCAFCLSLASRGPVYRSKQSAGDGASWHGGCDCAAVPVWDESPLPDGYDPEALTASYRQARIAAGSGDLKPILSAMRKIQGIN